jgi:hypothetical protein
MHQQHLPFAKIREIALLGFGPLQRHITIRYTGAELAALDEILANRWRHPSTDA